MILTFSRLLCQDAQAWRLIEKDAVRAHHTPIQMSAEGLKPNGKTGQALVA
jgi:hypothetical protein